MMRLPSGVNRISPIDCARCALPSSALPVAASIPIMRRFRDGSLRLPGGAAAGLHVAVLVAGEADARADDIAGGGYAALDRDIAPDRDAARRDDGEGAALGQG